MNTKSFLEDIIRYSQSLNDIIVGPLEYTPLEVRSTVHTSYQDILNDNVEQVENPYAGVEMTGFTVDRDDRLYFVGTNENLEYARVYYINNLVENILMSTPEELPDITEEEAVDELRDNRDVSDKELHRSIVKPISNSDCEFYYDTTEYGDIDYIEISQKIFPATDIETFDRTVQTVLNTGLNTSVMLSEIYDLEVSDSQYLQALKR